MEYIMNNQAVGDVATKLLANGFNVNALRPYIGKDGREYVSFIDNSGNFQAMPTANAGATLRKDEWKALDEAVVKAAQPRLKAIGDLRSRGLVHNIPNGMGTTVFQSQNQSDISGASTSMDGMREGENDRPLYDITNLPLPIIHKDFHFSARQIATSRNGGSPLDTSMAELAGRKVAEEAEKLLLGVADSYTFGGGTIYGYTNFPSRLTVTITDPTSSGWDGETLLDEVLEMKEKSQLDYHYGPWKLYVSPKWDRYLDNDFKSASDVTLRERLSKVEGIEGIDTLDYLENYDIVLVQMTPEVVREVIGTDVTTVQWDELGGMRKCFKVMAIMVPQIRADYNSNTGIVHGSTS